MIPLNPNPQTMPNPVTLPEEVDTVRPALEEGFLEGTARNPLPPAPADPPAGVQYRALPDPQGRPTLRPMGQETRPRRSPIPMFDLMRRGLMRAWSGDEHAEYQPLPDVPLDVQPIPATAGRRNTFRAEPQPWDAGVYVAARTDAVDRSMVR